MRRVITQLIVALTLSAPAAAQTRNYQTYDYGNGNYGTYGSDGSNFQTYNYGNGNYGTYGVDPEGNNFNCQTYGYGNGNAGTYCNQ